MRQRDPRKEEAIRKTAIRTIVRKGLDGLSMKQLAREARVSPATIYIYFRDRDDLILQTFLTANKRMYESTLRNFSPDMSFNEGMRIQWANRAEFFIKNPLEAEFIEQLRFSHLHHQTVFRQRENFSDIMKQFLNRAIKQKELIPLPFEVYWSVAFAPLYQLVKYHNQGQSIKHKEFRLTKKELFQTLGLVLKALKP